MKPLLLLLALVGPAQADAPVINSATAAHSGATWRFDVTLTHPDTGWDHYADGWQIETTDGRVLGTRILVHPHETEQPFTRSLSGVAIPDGTRSVQIRARCLVDGWSRDVAVLDLTR